MNIKQPFATIMVVLFSLSAIAHDSTQEYMSAEEVRQSVVGHTFYGIFIQDGKELSYSSFASPNGKAYYLDETGYREGGALIVRDDGCAFVNWEAGDEFDGCYYYKDNGDGTLTELTPGNRMETIRVVPGDPGNLSD
jgi:hypothetical protein